MRRARTFDDLLAIARADLHRQQDALIGSGADETRLEALISLTRQGVLPLESQCAGLAIENGQHGLRRNALWFITDEVTKNWMENALYYGEVAYDITVLECFGPASREYEHGGEPSGGVDVVKFVEGGVRRSGQQLTVDELHDRFPVRPALADELHRRWQVLIYQGYQDDPKNWSGFYERLLFCADGVYDAVEISRK